MGSPATDATPAAPGLEAGSTGRTGTRGLVAGLRRLAYGVFFLVPPRTRQRIVRLVVGRYAIGAVALVRDAEKPDRMLLIRSPRSLGWSLPGGVLQRRERPVDGCVRELAEETGVHLTADDVTPAVPNAIIRTEARWVDTVFEATVPASEVTPRADGLEVLEVAWHRLDNLPPLTIATARLLSHYGIGPYTDYPEVRA